MEDLFDNTILCKNCSKKMQDSEVIKSGFRLRAVRCPDCGNRIIHPEDLKHFESFSSLKRKHFRVKLRYVGNSYTVSIPREIIEFMSHRDKKRKDMVDLCFEEFGRLSLSF